MHPEPLQIADWNPPRSEAPAWRQRLLHAVTQEPLLVTRPSLDALAGGGFSSAPRAVFVGIGLVTPDAVSRVLPLDVLGILLPAERLRRAVGAERLVVLVADDNALENDLDPGQIRQVSRRAEEAQHLLERIGRRICPGRMTVQTAAELHQSPAYQRILAQVDEAAPDDEHGYFKQEVADIELLDRCWGGVLKVGWTVSASRDLRRRRDEVAFDRRFRRWRRRPLMSVYCRAGRSLDDRQLKASPYIAVDPQRRICLQPDEQVAAKLQRAAEWASPGTVNGVRNHLRALTRTYSQMITALEGTVEQRAQAVIEQIFAPNR